MAVFGSETSQARKQCNLQCELDHKYDYCCENKIINGERYKCIDELLKQDCEINCQGVCPPRPE